MSEIVCERERVWEREYVVAIVTLVYTWKAMKSFKQNNNLEMQFISRLKSIYLT